MLNHHPPHPPHPRHPPSLPTHFRLIPLPWMNRHLTNFNAFIRDWVVGFYCFSLPKYPLPRRAAYATSSQDVNISPVFRYFGPVRSTLSRYRHRRWPLDVRPSRLRLGETLSRSLLLRHRAVSHRWNRKREAIHHHNEQYVTLYQHRLRRQRNQSSGNSERNPVSAVRYPPYSFACSLFFSLSSLNSSPIIIITTGIIHNGCAE